MAKAISDEELQLKKRARRRLVGAVALVLLIVVFLPMVLDSEPKPLNQDVSITIPPIPKGESASQLPVPEVPPAVAAQAATPQVAGLPQGAPAAASPASSAVEMKVDPVQENAPKTESPKAEAAPKSRPESRPAAKAPPRHEVKPAAAVATTGEEAFVVQLGAFSNAINAKALQRKLQDNKFKAYTELVKNAGGDRTRVRVGPYASKEAAEKARDRLKSMKLIIGDAAVVRQD